MDYPKFYASLGTDKLEAMLDRNSQHLHSPYTFVGKAKVVLQTIGLCLLMGSAFNIILDGINIIYGVLLLLSGLLVYWMHRDIERFNHLKVQNDFIRHELSNRRRNQ